MKVSFTHKVTAKNDKKVTILPTSHILPTSYSGRNKTEQSGYGWREITKRICSWQSISQGRWKSPFAKFGQKMASLTLPCSDFSLSPDGNYEFLSATFPRMNHGCGRRGVWGKGPYFSLPRLLGSLFHLPVLQRIFKLFAPPPMVSVYIESRNLRLWGNFFHMAPWFYRNLFLPPTDPFPLLRISPAVCSSWSSSSSWPQRQSHQVFGEAGGTNQLSRSI